MPLMNTEQYLAIQTKLPITNAVWYFNSVFLAVLVLCHRSIVLKLNLYSKKDKFTFPQLENASKLVKNQPKLPVTATTSLNIGILLSFLNFLGVKIA